MKAFYYSSASELNIACHFTIACGVALLVELHIFLFNQLSITELFMRAKISLKLREKKELTQVDSKGKKIKKPDLAAH